MVTSNLPAVGETFIFRPRRINAFGNRAGELVTVTAVPANQHSSVYTCQFTGGATYGLYADELDRIVPSKGTPGRTRVYVTAWDHSTLGAYSQFDWSFVRGTMADRYDSLLTKEIDHTPMETREGLYLRLLTAEVPDTENIGEYLLNHAGRRFSSRDGWELLALTGQAPDGLGDPYPDNVPEQEVYAEHRFPMLAMYCVLVNDNEAGDEYIVKDNYAGAVNLYQKYLDELHHGTVHLLALTPPLNWDYPNWTSIVEIMAMQAHEARDWSRWVHLSEFTRTPKEYTAQLHEGTHPLYPKR